jgi:hypothetical protein
LNKVNVHESRNDKIIKLILAAYPDKELFPFKK